jgi:predicted nucleic acid-binding protein
MIGTPIRCVIDASVGIKRVVTEPDSARAHALFEHLDKDAAATFFVPDFFFLECTNILWKLVKKTTLTTAEATTSLADLRAQPLSVVAVETVLDDVLVLAAAHDISAYDAAYVVAAVRLGVPLITADAKLAGKLAGTPYQIALFSTLTIPALPPTSAGS